VTGPAAPRPEGTGPLDGPGARSVLGQAHHLFIAMATAGGPHITPELFVVHSGRLWCLVAASTLKARRLSRGERVGVYVPGPAGHLIGSGKAVVVDPARPLSLLREPSVAAAATTAVGLYALRNSAELTGAALDLLRGRLGGPFPPHRVALCIEITDVRLVGGPVIAEPGVPSRATQGDPEVPEGLPPGMLDLLCDGPAAVAWCRAGCAPVAVPGRWEAATATVLIPSDSPTPPVGGDGPVQVAVTRDSWSGLGPSGKQGIMIRGWGTAKASSPGPAVTAIAVDVERWTFWDGVATETAGRRGHVRHPRPA
jgi:hypothetical protein